MLMGGGHIRKWSEWKKISSPQRGPEKLKVNCLVVIVKIRFKWYNNVVATNIADWNIPFVTLYDADFSVILRKLENFKLLVLCVI